jgi:WD40-like Beta Propeller Repeat
VAGSFVPRQPGEDGVEPEEKDMCVMDGDGTNVRRLTDDLGKDERPVWSPGGTKMAFSTDRDGQQEIYVMNADASGQHRLTDNPARDESPYWQPLPFNDEGHEPCGDVSLAAGGVSSVVTLKAPCDTAQRVAQRWADAADTGALDDKVGGFRCTPSHEPYDLVVVRCSHEGGKKDIAFVWRQATL